MRPRHRQLPVEPLSAAGDPLHARVVGLPLAVAGYVLDRLHGPGWLPGVILALLTALTGTCAAAVVHATERLSRTTTMAIGAGAYGVWSVSVLAAAFLPASVRTAWLLGTTLLLASASLLFGAPPKRRQPSLTGALGCAACRA